MKGEFFNTFRIGVRVQAFQNYYKHTFNRNGPKICIPALKYADIHAVSSLDASYTLS